MGAQLGFCRRLTKHYKVNFLLRYCICGIPLASRLMLYTLFLRVIILLLLLPTYGSSLDEVNHMYCTTCIGVRIANFHTDDVKRNNIHNKHDRPF